MKFLVNEIISQAAGQTVAVPVTVKAMSNNITYLRRRKGWTQKRLAGMIGEHGIPVPTLNRIETGYTQGFEKYRQAIAKALGCAPEDLDSPDLDMPTVPVTGIIRHKSFIQDVPADKQERVEPPMGLPDSTEALRIKQQGLKPYHGNNDVLFYDGIPTTQERYFVERECVVKLAGKTRGEKLLAWVSKGSKPGHFILQPHGAPLMIDVAITAAHPILHVKRA
jgi:transcriptional regulator with XRE-family HTH domain